MVYKPSIARSEHGSRLPPFLLVATSVFAMATIEEIPLDIFLVTFPHIDIKSLLRLRQTSRRLRDITNDRNVWFLVLRDHIVKEHIPIPDIVTSQFPALLATYSNPFDFSTLDGLSRIDLEMIVRYAYVCHKRWTSALPSSTTSCVISPIEEDLAGRVIKLQFFKKASRTYLLMGRLLPPALGIRSIECWNVDATPPICVARWKNPDSPAVVRYCLNTSEDYEHTLAVMFSQPSDSCLEQWRFDPDGVEKDFETSLICENVPIHTIDAFTRSTIAFRTTVTDPGTVLRSAHPRVQYKLLENHLHQEEQCYEVLLKDNLVVIFRSTAISLYTLPSQSGSPATIELQPFARYTFQWRVDSARLAFHSYTKSIMMLLRFNSGYPWPVNFLHHYKISLPDQAMPEPPVLLQVIPAPVRLFSVTDMALGTYNTALWIDTHVEDYSMDGIMRGQRLAGRVLPTFLDEEALRNDIFQNGIGSPGTTSVFGIRDEDDWDRVALDERALKIAVSTSNGKVLLMGYT